MKSLHRLIAFLALLLPAPLLADDLTPRHWTVDKVDREALIYLPPHLAADHPAPLIFVFHGHGGSSRQAARSFHLHDLLPDSIIVYPQGLPTPGRLTDPDGKRPGWQGRAGEGSDRDLHFFDAMLSSLQHDYPVDKSRIFCTGHSNGGLFTYLLWSQRGDTFAALAPSAAIATLDMLPKLKPKPVLHCAGRTDTLVKFSWQEQTISQLKKLDGCSDDTAEHLSDHVTRYPGKDHVFVETFLHDGGHPLPPDEPQAIASFFKSIPPTQVP